MITLPDLGSNGRLGNQLFQLASAYAHCRRTDQTLFVPDIDLIRKLKPCVSLAVGSPMPSQPCRYHEPRFGYEPIPRSLTDASIYGYFQSERYFDDMPDVIADLLQPDDAILQAATAWIDTVRGSSGLPVVAVGVRRGDYVDKASYHPLQPMSYYEAASNHLGDATFVVFSDDVPWCEANMQLPNIHFCREPDPWLSIWMQSRCDHHITPNSTFHWWGAWLNRKPGKRVIAPLMWFGPAAGGLQNQTGDICPPAWQRI